MPHLFPGSEVTPERAITATPMGVAALPRWGLCHQLGDTGEHRQGHGTGDREAGSLARCGGPCHSRHLARACRGRGVSLAPHPPPASAPGARGQARRTRKAPGSGHLPAAGRGGPLVTVVSVVPSHSPATRMWVQPPRETFWPAGSHRPCRGQLGRRGAAQTAARRGPPAAPASSRPAEGLL